MVKSSLMFTILFLSFLSLSFSQTTILIPDDYETIQAGLNAANEGDTVLVSPGTYYENIIWPNKNGIKLSGINEGDYSIINGNNLGSVILFNFLDEEFIDTSTVIENFIVEDGNNTNNGGGIYLVNSSPYIKNMIIRNNSSIDHGGGIYLIMSSPKIENVILLNNLTVGSGGGAYLDDSHPLFLDSEIRNNTARSGGGILIKNSNPEIINVEISENTAWNFGGGLLIGGNSEPTMNSCLILKNTASEGGGMNINYSGGFYSQLIVEENSALTGGGFYLYGSYSSIISSTIINNTSKFGGGLSLIESETTLRQLNLINNVSSGDGGGIFLRPGKATNTMENVNVISNYAKNKGGGIFIDEHRDNYGTLILNSTTICNNSSGVELGNAIYQSGGIVEIINSNFVKNGFAIHNSNSNIITIATNNYWNSQTGPYHPNQNPSGVGDSVSNFINVSPWLTNPNIDAPPIPAMNLDVILKTNSSVSFNWGKSLIGDLAGYKVYYDTDSTSWEFNNSVDVVLDTTFALSNLDSGKEYYIAVTCYDREGNESWFSETLSITSMFATPLLLSPENNASNISLTTTLSWSEVSGADHYKLEVSQDENFSVEYDLDTTISKNFFIISSLISNTQYYWRIKALNSLGNNSEYSEAFTFTTLDPTSVHEEFLPREYELSQNYPNPFNPSTIINYAIPKQGEVKIVLYDALGKEVGVFVNKNHSAGYYTYELDASSFSSGVYLYQIITNKFVDTKKMILIK